MNEPSINPDTFFTQSCFLELSLILVAFFLGWLADINPIAYLHLNETALWNGLIATLPLCIIFVALNHLDHKALQELNKNLRDTLGRSLHKQHWTDLLILAMIAGISEEILFRGLIQPWMENSWGFTAGLISSSVLFGLLHAITPLYFVMATFASLYLGLCLDYDGSRNLFTPIIIHGLYDFFAFSMILKHYRHEQRLNLK